MRQPTPQEHLRAYQQWRLRIAGAIREFDGWLDVNHYATPETRARIEAALVSMQADRLNVAFLSAGGREKSALIDALLPQSGIGTLNTQILTELLHAKRQAHVDGLEAGVGKMLDRHRASMVARMDRTKMRLGKLESCRGKFSTLITEMLDRTRQEQELYLRAVQRLQESQTRLTLATLRCRDILDRSKMDALIVQVRSDMARSWTTVGMATAMKGLFDELLRAMQAICTETEHTRKLVRELYAGFEHDFGFALTTPKVFTPRDFRVEIELLHREVDAFRHSPTLAFAERGVVIKRFDEDMVTRARSLFDQLSATFDTWERDTLQPLAQRIQEHASATEQDLNKLQRLGRSYDATRRHIEATQARYAELAQQLTALRNIHNTINRDPTPEYTPGANRRGAGQRA